MADTKSSITDGCVGLEYPSGFETDDKLIRGGICDVFLKLVDLDFVEENLSGSIFNLLEVCS